MSWCVVPPAERYWLRRAIVPLGLVEGVTLANARDHLAEADILIEHGKIAAIALPGTAPAPESAFLDLDRSMVLPALVDMHTHLDKGHIWPRRPNPDGTWDAALEAVRADREGSWGAADVRVRMDFSLRAAYAHGTKLIRTHLDSLPPQDEISWELFAEMRESWAGRIDLQAVALFPLERAVEPGLLDRLADRVAGHGGVLGGSGTAREGIDAALDALFTAAAARGLDLDLHIDETEDPGSDALLRVAEAKLRHGFEGRVVCGHCCSLAVQPEDVAKRTLDRVAAAGLAVVSLPMCNMYLQDRHAGRTPRWRGVTLLHEMHARNIPVAVASDNTRDPFYAYGDLDMVEVFREAVRILHLDHPFDHWPRTIAWTPAEILGRPDCGRLKAGQDADLVMFRARSWTEFLARPQSDRIVMRAGRPIEAELPDYRELDGLMG